MLTQEEAIKKVKKLLRLAGSSNPHEAALAAQRAQEILDRYALQACMLDTDVEEKIQSTNKDGKGLDQLGAHVTTWKSYLSAVVARANGCRSVVQGEYHYPSYDRVMVLHVIGRPSDASKVRYIYSYVVAEVDRLLRKHGRHKGKTWRNNFRLGVVDAVKEKLEKSKKNAEQKLRAKYQDNPLALVKLDQAVAQMDSRLREVDDWIRQHMDMAQSAVPVINPHRLAREFGKECGRNLDWNSANAYLPASV